MRRLAKTLALAGGLHVLLGSTAWAAGGSGTDTGGTTKGGTPEATVTVYGAGGATLGSATVRRSGTGGSNIRCYYFAGIASTTGAGGWGMSLDLSTPVAPEAKKLYGFYCYDEGNQVVSAQMIYFNPADPLGGLYAEERALAEARRRLPLPDPVIATDPPVGTDHLVGLPTRLRLDGDWSEQSASASVGPVTATVIARPIEVRFDPGDGSPTVTCHDPGHPFDPSSPPEDDGCDHTYQRRSTASASGTFPLQATVTWEVRWQATTGGGGPLDPVTRTSTVPMRVVEAQAVLR